MTSRSDPPDAAAHADQGTLFPASDENHEAQDSTIQSGLPILAEMACTVAIERLPKGLRVSARDHNRRTLWGFVASRGVLEQPHAAIAVYSALREALDRHLDTATRDEASVPAVLDAANGVLDDLEQLARAMRGALISKADAKPSATVIAQAVGIYRGVSDALRMLSQDLNMQTSSEVAADDSGSGV